MKLLPLAGIVLGAASFLLGIRGEDPSRAWGSYLVNLVFWMGICMGSITWVAIMNMTNASWGRPLKRLAEAQVATMPFLWILVALLYAGHRSLYIWSTHPVHGKERWLEADFLFGRDLLVIGAMTLVSYFLVHQSVRADEEKLLGGDETSVRLRWRRQILLSPVLGILYGVGMSVLAWDLIMSLDPHWVSTLFGGYYFMGGLYSALAWLAVLSFLFHRREGIQGKIDGSVFHDLGKLLFAFCLVTGDFFYSQFLVIWYGNIPEETKYVILRVKTEPWNSVAWVVLAGAFGIPFVALLSRKLKMSPPLLGATALVVLGGMWLERFLLVVPSVGARGQIPLGWAEVGVAVGFLSLEIMCFRWFMERVPWLPVGDPLFEKRWGSLSGDPLEVSGHLPGSNKGGKVRG
jgi:hypothetical protein